MLNKRNQKRWHNLHQKKEKKRKKNNNQIPKFPGFPEPYQSWDFPTILNGYIHLLTGAEFKVLWYILRHTYGWQKDQDEISLTQLKKGIQKKDGSWLDRGTGLSRQGIIDAIYGRENNKGKCLGLIKKGFIKKSKGRKANCFKLVVKKVDYPSQQSGLVGSQKNRHTIPNITISNKTKIRGLSSLKSKNNLKKDIADVIANYKELYQRYTEKYYGKPQEYPYPVGQRDRKSIRAFLEAGHSKEDAFNLCWFYLNGSECEWYREKHGTKIFRAFSEYNIERWKKEWPKYEEDFL